MGDKKKVLIVDDSETMRSILSMRFEVSGYDVIIASDGEEALEKAKKEKPAILILDLMLPKINGYEVCQMLKFDEKYKDLPIIILSALDQQEEREKAVKSGADAYFIKPFDLDLLITKVKSFVG